MVRGYELIIFLEREGKKEEEKILNTVSRDWRQNENTSTCVSLSDRHLPVLKMPRSFSKARWHSPTCQKQLLDNWKLILRCLEKTLF